MDIRVLSGNELIVQGGLEAGFHLYTGYPGSPLADYFNVLYHRRNELKKKGIRVAIANSEANAAAMVSGAKQAGRDSMVAMKSMGLHVASDALSVGNFAEPGKRFFEPETGEEVGPGVVVVVGDDPWSISTSTAADSRYLFKHLHIPFLEPATPVELKDWIKTALSISRRSGLYQGVLLTTFMAEGGGRVEVLPEAKVDGHLEALSSQEFDLQRLVMVPPNSLQADISMNRERFPKVVKVLGKLELDQTFGRQDSRVGFISGGSTFETLKQVLEEMGALERVGLFKVAGSYPLVPNKLKPWLMGKQNIVVVEEKRGFLEGELVHAMEEWKVQGKIWGKRFETDEGFPSYGGLNYEIVSTKVRQVFQLLDQSCSSSSMEPVATLSWENDLPKRTPTFCPGCPHRETLSLLKDLRQSLKGKGIDLISHGDVGCYSLSFLPPFKEMHNLSAMGQGGALGAGVDTFTSNPSVVLMGDSTFYHSGVNNISNSVQLGHNITYIILDNDNTAMTGHQVTPSSGVNVLGEERPRQNMLQAVQSFGVETAIEINPSDRYFYKNILEQYVLKKGVKVIISNKECALTFYGRENARWRKDFSQGKTLPVQKFYQINTAVCEDCRECVEMTGCPGLTQTMDAYGSKVSIDPQICVADSYCTKIKACPSFDLVEVANYHPDKYRNKKKVSVAVDSLPIPQVFKSLEDIAGGQDWRALITGVGGSGVTTISRVLAEAAREMNGRTDLNFKFVDQKGLAQRNGNVTAHLSIFSKNKSYGSVTPRGTADLLLSPDLLDGSSHLSFLGKEGFCLLGDDFQVPLSLMLNRGVEKEPMDKEGLKKKIVNKLGEQVKLLPFKKISENILGKNIYVSVMILGSAWQSGRLPFSLENMKTALTKVIRSEELEANLRAFDLGRDIFLREDNFENHSDKYVHHRKDDRIHQLRMSLNESFLPWQGIKSILKNFDDNLEKLYRVFPEVKRHYLAQYLHDIYIYDRGHKVKKFLEQAGKVADLYGNSVEEKTIALRTLARTYWVKDEVFVAHQMVSSVQKRIERVRYGNRGTSYRVIHINRPAFELWKGKKIEFDLSPKDWMLKIMRQGRWLRKILPHWHKRDRQIAHKVRQEILNTIPQLQGEQRRVRLKTLENIKGYRSIRYKVAEEVGV